jgi:hypothetical protein
VAAVDPSGLKIIEDLPDELGRLGKRLRQLDEQIARATDTRGQRQDLRAVLVDLYAQGAQVARLHGARITSNLVSRCDVLLRVSQSVPGVNTLLAAAGIFLYLGGE